MIATAKPDCLQVMVHPDFTARLAKQASGKGLSTVEMAFDLLSRSLDALEGRSNIASGKTNTGKEVAAA